MITQDNNDYLTLERESFEGYVSDAATWKKLTEKQRRFIMVEAYYQQHKAANNKLPQPRPLSELAKDAVRDALVGGTSLADLSTILHDVPAPHWQLPNKRMQDELASEEWAKHYKTLNQ